ncbi:PB1-F2 protein [Influenza A virus (A/glaucous-winged gull/Southeastern Alaska/10JR01572R0/2010(H16N3))]|uniref:Protein PB1-F2 n=2 Tax=H16N3 subtype TaxID=304360 RepID=L0MPM7_9INFA|nr:PB1-F2 protein [Influenza A virus (A/gull/Southeastern Alaska/10JR01527R0/2010(H16N3))]AGB98390.1 PB1-F2 protein [Influenza A virus (A/glaucous-winged gull/Southeastern Alaska/10JR01572R0/2010(H16N3))]
MEREQDTPWTQLPEHISIQKKGGGQQTQRLEHLNSIQSMDHCLKTTSQVGMHKQTVSWKQWPSLKSPTLAFLKIRVLKRWKLSNKQEWTN